MAWTTEGGTRIPRSDSVVTAAADTTPEAKVFLQVSSSQNPDWADDLANKLKKLGLNASVLKPRREGDAFRVVLGPYDSREPPRLKGVSWADRSLSISQSLNKSRVWHASEIAIALTLRPFLHRRIRHVATREMRCASNRRLTTR